MDTAVTTVKRSWAALRNFHSIPGRGKGNFVFSAAFKMVMGPTQPPCSVSTKGPLPAHKAARV